jgi:hypothetical protein
MNKKKDTVRFSFWEIRVKHINRDDLIAADKRIRTNLNITDGRPLMPEDLLTGLQINGIISSDTIVKTEDDAPVSLPELMTITEIG